MDKNLALIYCDLIWSGPFKNTELRTQPYPSLTVGKLLMPV